ncbi:hypothetical protein CDAR_110581 [Caerostris darwini]|uniref:Uncharacterized protein n=1 Tax=Caerostris darwini TaxID=1538125 RepID=A0AAV4QIA7_9ARAC|nr:hypothetical protein CDAR_110581 [Caerostris darwini]
MVRQRRRPTSSWASPCACQPRSTKCSTCPARVLRAQMTYDLNCHRHSAAVEGALSGMVNGERIGRNRWYARLGRFLSGFRLADSASKTPSTSEGGSSP